jgi:hypothetical protein
MKVLGVTKGKKHEAKDTWLWHEDVQKAIKENKKSYKSWHHERKQECKARPGRSKGQRKVKGI